VLSHCALSLCSLTVLSHCALTLCSLTVIPGPSQAPALTQELGSSGSAAASGTPVLSASAAPSTVVFDELLLNRILCDPRKPTAVWMACTVLGDAATCCLRRLPRLQADSPKKIRYTCTICHHDSSTSLVAASNQLNEFWKHISSQTHVSKIVELHPRDDMQQLVISVIPALKEIRRTYDLLSSKQKERATEPKFYDTDLETLKLSVTLDTVGASSDASEAFIRAFDYGVGTAAGSRGARLASRKRKTAASPSEPSVAARNATLSRADPPSVPPVSAISALLNLETNPDDESAAALGLASALSTPGVTPTPTSSHAAPLPRDFGVAGLTNPPGIGLSSSLEGMYRRANMRTKQSYNNASKSA
jgi:hypothetical protein